MAALQEALLGAAPHGGSVPVNLLDELAGTL
jgi:hypothetical protein